MNAHADGSVWRDAPVGGGRPSLPPPPPTGASVLIDMTGHVSGDLTVLRRAPSTDGIVRWVCACACGGEAVVTGKRLRCNTAPTSCAPCGRKRGRATYSETIARRTDGLPAHARRGRTVSVHRISKAIMARDAAEYGGEHALHQRPRVRLDCLPGGCNEARPCPWVSCKWHLALEVHEGSGNIKLAFPDSRGEPDFAAMRATCALDVADDVDASNDGATMEHIGAALGLTRQRIQQIEIEALDKVRGPAVDAGQVDHLDETPDGPHLYGRMHGGSASFADMSVRDAATDRVHRVAR